MARFLELDEHGAPFSHEYRILRPDGSVAWILDRGFPVRGANGDIKAYAGIAQDITERKEADAAIREREAILHGFFESPGAARGVVEMVHGEVIHLSDNAEAAALFGLTQETMRGKLDAELGIPEDVRQRWIHEYERSRTTGLPVQFEYLHVADGVRWLAAVVSHIGVGTTGNQRFAYATVDITREKRAQQALQESEERFQSAFDYAPIGMALVGSKGRFLRVNRAAVRLGRLFREGTASEELPGDHPPLTICPPISPKPMSYGREKRAAIEREKRYFHKLGHTVWALLSESLVLDDRGNPKYYISQIQDITERKRLEDSLIQAQKTQAIGQLAGGIAHDFNNLLTVINGHADLLQNQCPPAAPEAIAWCRSGTPESAPES